MIIMWVFFLILFIKAYVVGTHLNCIDLQVNAIQMSTHNICLYKEVKKKYTGCNLKTTEFLHCAIIGICAVIRSNTVFNEAYATFLSVFLNTCHAEYIKMPCPLLISSQSDYLI